MNICVAWLTRLYADMACGQKKDTVELYCFHIVIYIITAKKTM